MKFKRKENYDYLDFIGDTACVLLWVMPIVALIVAPWPYDHTTRWNEPSIPLSVGPSLLLFLIGFILAKIKQRKP